MAWLFLLVSLVGAGLTYNVYRPHLSSPRRSLLSFSVGWLWGELAIHVVLAQVVVVTIFAMLGALQGAAGQLALLITAVSCGALIYNYIEYGSAAEVIDEALREGLGEGYDREIDADLRDIFDHDIRWAELMLPFSFKHPDVERIRDIPFDRQRGIDLKLDVYRHRSMPKKCPVLLQIHGGGWVIGDKREQALPLMYQLAANGWVCISANYRLSPHATFPEHLIDCKKALAWIREHGAKYGADPDFVVVTGGSAGGHLSSLVALTANVAEYQPGFEDVDTSVYAAVPFYGVYDWTNRFGYWQHDGMQQILEDRILKGSIEEIPEEYSKGSPMSWITEDHPPFLIIHGENDSLAPVAEARKFAEMLREKGSAQVVYAEIPGAQHAFDIFKTLRGQIVLGGVERFVTYMYSRYRETRPADKAVAVGNGAEGRAPAANASGDEASV